MKKVDQVIEYLQFWLGFTYASCVRQSETAAYIRVRVTFEADAAGWF